MLSLCESSKHLFPGKPTFTEANLPDLQNKARLSLSLSLAPQHRLTSQVYIVTGANTGIGKQVAQALFSRNATVYVAARTPAKAADAIQDIKAALPDSTGSLVYLKLDLADLVSVKAAATEFLGKEASLNVLFNNAGVMNPPAGSSSKQGYELQLGTNNIGTHLFTRLLTPALVTAAKTAPAGSVRVVWLSSIAADVLGPKYGIDVSHVRQNLRSKIPFADYSISKAGNYLQAVEYGRRHEQDGILSMAVNPGNLSSELWRTQTSFAQRLLTTFFLYPTVYGASTELYAGFSKDVEGDMEGKWGKP